MSRFFINRPIFAWVIAIVLMLAGGLAIRSLPISQFPAIAPPTVQINASYPGADAQTIENTTTQIIEQQLKGLDHLRYFASTSNSGSVRITLTFDQGTNPDIAQVQVQNKLQAATPLLPQEVQQQGVTVTKSTASFLLIIGLYSDTRQHNGADLGDYMVARLQDPISRVAGVGELQVFGGQYAMRIWVDPLKLNSYRLTMSDVTAAIRAQNAQVSAGQLGGQPARTEQMLNATVSIASRLQTPEQFGAIVLRSDADGSVIHVSDVARVEKSAENTSFDLVYNGMPGSGMGIRLAPGANALTTVDAVKAKVEEIARQLPPDVKVVYPYDSTPFVRLSVKQVVETLVEAVFLVFIVMFVFLQNFRATLIPTIAVPVVLLGTFAVLAIVGYSINTLTLFGMVLAIGLLVDDAIVVVENVERLITEEGLSPRKAALKSMDEITGALVGIAVVLSAVFVPMAFFSGSTGVIFRQFSVTIVSAMVLSVLVALILTPALCATILKPHDPDKHEGHGPLARFFRGFNRVFQKGTERYEVGVRKTARGWKRAFLAFALIVGGVALLFSRLPTGFLPDEDQGQMLAVVQLPAGATKARTDAALKYLRDYLLTKESANVAGVFTLSGFSLAGSGQNAGQAFISLKNWDDRSGKDNRAQAIAARASQAYARWNDGLIFAIVPPAVSELGNATGFDFQLVDDSGIGHARLRAARNQMLGMAAQDPRLAGVRPVSLDDAPQLKIDVDRDKASALGLAIADINGTISTAWGGSYVNDFIDRGRVKRVYVQADAPFREKPEDLDDFFVRGIGGKMTPYSAFSTLSWEQAPVQLSRYNGRPAMEIQGTPSIGGSSGAAIKAMAELHKKLPPGTAFEWTGISYEEQLSGGQAPILYGLSLLIVFLCLAALYESWSIPLAVLLVVPLGIVGALFAAWVTGLSNDIYLQVGLITTMGVSAKNAILIVEFAEERLQEGMSTLEAAVSAAKIRLRPILMTSFAFIFGVMPLALSTGAGAGGQNAIGRAVVGGMLSATILAIFFVPMFFVVIGRLVGHGRTEARGAGDDDEPLRLPAPQGA